MGTLTTLLPWAAVLAALGYLIGRIERMADDNKTILEQAATDIAAAASTLEAFVSQAGETFDAIGKTVGDASNQLTTLIGELEGSGEQADIGAAVKAIADARDKLTAVTATTSVALDAAKAASAAATGLDESLTADVAAHTPATSS